VACAASKRSRGGGAPLSRPAATDSVTRVVQTLLLAEVVADLEPGATAPEHRTRTIRRNAMPDIDEPDRSDDDTVEVPPEEESRTGEEQAAINRENDPPA
jgi:hypothetical protein